MTEPLSILPGLDDAAAAASADPGHRSLRFLVRSAAALVTTTGLTSGLGFAYWALGARFFPVTAVGEASTAIAAMTLLATFATLGFGTLLMSELPGMNSRRTDLVASTALLSGCAGTVLSVVAALSLPRSFTGLPGVGSSPGTTAVFALGVGVTAVTLVLDQGLLSLLGGGPQLWRNAVLSVVKLALLVALALTLHSAGAMSIYASWLVGNATSVVVLIAWAVVRHGVRIHRARPAVHLLQGLHRDALEHHALNLALQLPYFAMPIVASVVLGSQDAGHLYATWSIAGFVFVLPIALSTSLFAAGARGAQDFDKQLRFTLRYSLLACIAANAVLLPFGGLVLRIFGSEYEGAARWALVLVSLGGLPLIVKDHHVSIARVTGRVGHEASVVWALSIGELAGAAVGAHLGGLLGLATGWLCAVTAEGIVFLPYLLRTLASGSGPAHGAHGQGRHRPSRG